MTEEKKITGMEKYAYSKKVLQDKVGLSKKEARAYLVSSGRHRTTWQRI